MDLGLTNITLACKSGEDPLLPRLNEGGEVAASDEVNQVEAALVGGSEAVTHVTGHGPTPQSDGPGPLLLGAVDDVGLVVIHNCDTARLETNTVLKIVKSK